MLTEEFGKRLRYWRKKRGLSLMNLYRKSGVAPSSISRYENDNRCPMLQTLEALLNALNISIVDFFSEEIKNG